jgi:hypothetical protein
MLNLNTEDINSIGNTIGTLIFFIIIIIGLLIIFDEIFNLSKFCFKYTYLYNYGKLNENICNKDNNNLIEFERSRYRVHNEINNYKMEKDLFNKNWINYVVFVSILLMSILMCFAFGYLFFHLFIFTNLDCEIDENNLSFINNILKCTGNNKSYIPNCSFSYFILFILIFIYPLIFIIKFLVNVDYSLDNKGTYTKIFHLFILISLLYYIYVLIYMDNNDNDYKNLTKIGIYISFLIIFYVVNIIYNKAYSDYYNINKGTNIYSRDKSIIGILNKFFHFANDNDNDDFRDINFFEIYKQQEPTKPKEFEKPDELETFKYCKDDEDFIDVKNTYCYGYKDKKEEYKKIKTKINDYYQKKKQYEKDLNIYNLKYNIYKNNKIEFPEFVPILSHLVPKLLGYNKTNIILFISLLIFLFYYNYLKTNNKQKEANYIYSTIIIYIISLLSILILSNSVLTYNTYVNKYLIYEPIAYYKEDLFNMDVLFNALLNKDSDKTISNQYLYLYNKISSKKISAFSSIEQSNKSLNDLIKTIDGNNVFTDIDIKNSTNDNLNKFRCQILRVLFSDLLKINTSFDLTNIEKIFKYKDIYFNSDKYKEYIPKENFLISESGDVPDQINLRTFLIIIKNIFVEDKRSFDKHIQKIKNNLKYIIYGDISNIICIPLGDTDLNFYNLFLINDVINDDLSKIDNTKNNEYIRLYLHNLNYINIIFENYKDFLKEFRDKIIDLFNSTEIICEDKENVININNKLNTYINKIIKKNDNLNIDFNNKNIFDDFTYKEPKTEPKINIYKKILKNKIKEINTLFRKYFNIIKAIYRKGFEITEESSSNKLEYNVINNYNFFNKDTTKHLSKILLKYSININNEDKNKYDSYDSERLLKLNLSINNIGWSFVILMIIIAIFLIEPIIIQS